eukprot:TRINITY_DN48827_c0_g1_i1.p1 TRINITY_DN48827_c0_g1~~TRINITY_DN48827_c0_g1_i1.p1  ORF type:complete len:585 (-),score=191.83 TRINITY_DN48827_c0_g1_i1:13-1767(-)
MPQQTRPGLLLLLLLLHLVDAGEDSAASSLRGSAAGSIDGAEGAVGKGEAVSADGNPDVGSEPSQPGSQGMPAADGVGFQDSQAGEVTGATAAVAATDSRDGESTADQNIEPSQQGEGTAAAEGGHAVASLSEDASADRENAQSSPSEVENSKAEEGTPAVAGVDASAMLDSAADADDQSSKPKEGLPATDNSAAAAALGNDAAADSTEAHLGESGSSNDEQGTPAAGSVDAAATLDGAAASASGDDSLSEQSESSKLEEGTPVANENGAAASLAADTAAASVVDRVKTPLSKGEDSKPDEGDGAAGATMSDVAGGESEGNRTAETAHSKAAEGAEIVGDAGDADTAAGNLTSADNVSEASTPHEGNALADGADASAAGISEGMPDASLNHNEDSGSPPGQSVVQSSSEEGREQNPWSQSESKVGRTWTILDPASKEALLRAQERSRSGSRFLSFYEDFVRDGRAAELMPDPFFEPESESASRQKGGSDRASGACKFVDDYDYIGQDVITLQNSNEAACCKACNARNAKRHGTCQVAVLSSPTDDPPSACWIKKGVVKSVAKAGVVACVSKEYQELLAASPEDV